MKVNLPRPDMAWRISAPLLRTAYMLSKQNLDTGRREMIIIDRARAVKERWRSNYTSHISFLGLECLSLYRIDNGTPAYSVQNKRLRNFGALF